MPMKDCEIKPAAPTPPSWNTTLLTSRLEWPKAVVVPSRSIGFAALSPRRVSESEPEGLLCQDCFTQTVAGLLHDAGDAIPRLVRPAVPHRSRCTGPRQCPRLCCRGVAAVLYVQCGCCIRVPRCQDILPPSLHTCRAIRMKHGLQGASVR
ncbi:hypothetical protein CGRA01v4_07313 [Colletotrichum graminicola]|nr:hypothetical protein CGRA01v4_07313 [Colletotrichum graminicola]